MELEAAVDKAIEFTEKFSGSWDSTPKLLNVKKEGDEWHVTLDIGDKYPEIILVVVDDIKDKIVRYDRKLEEK
jgi:hypothetical protein